MFYDDDWSLPVRGAWIEMSTYSVDRMTFGMSLPVRGAWIEMAWRMKPQHRSASLPVRGAWIEIYCNARLRHALHRRSPCGERGLKLQPLQNGFNSVSGRSPCGERGLKCKISYPLEIVTRSLPVRGAWIEIGLLISQTMSTTSLPVRGAWIEISNSSIRRLSVPSSLPVRGAWIEIPDASTHNSAPESLPVRGAWIEITNPNTTASVRSRRSPCGERGLKCEVCIDTHYHHRRSPCGERGLK